MFTNFTPYSNQLNIDKINNQIAELEKMKSQMQQPQQPTSLTQNFQLTPSRESMKYASSLDEVQKDIVYIDTPFFSRDMSVVWVKNAKGDIKTYELNEIIPRDEKDLRIEYLEAQIKELKEGMIKDGRFTNTNKSNNSTSKNEKSSSISTSTKSNEKSK